MSNIVRLNPAVCVVGKTYQIVVLSEKDALISIRIGDKTYYNHSNGVKISAAGVHKISVPSDVLDSECGYTVIVEEMIERLSHFSKVATPVEIYYKFRPIEKTSGINIYHLADVHGEFQQALNCAGFAKKEIDLLIMNGDISSSSDTLDDMILCYKIASELAGGEIPCVISRGNHDLRGAGAEKLAENMPGDCGKSYYTFKVGCIWGILMDAGEDKVDSHPEYAGTICCHEFRLEQEQMIKNTIENASDEYGSDDVKYKLVISHIPFTFSEKRVFSIERELYANWAKLIKENIKPDIMLCGHTHRACISEPDSERDELGNPCTVIVGSNVNKSEDGKITIAGSSVTLNDGFATVEVNTETEILLSGRVDF